MVRIPETEAYTDGIWAAFVVESETIATLGIILPNAAPHESDTGSSMRQCQLC